MGCFRFAAGLAWASVACGGAIEGTTGAPVADAEIPSDAAASQDSRQQPAADAPADVSPRATPMEAAAYGGRDGCVPGTCESLGYECGQGPDHCDGVITCASTSIAGGSTIPIGCPETLVCGITAPNRCGPPPTCPGPPPEAPPLTCERAGYDCGLNGDGFGAAIDCGRCPPSLVCVAPTCVHLDAGPSCTPVTCADYGATCGRVGNGCNGVLYCGTCPAPQYCGGGGVHRCGGVCRDQPISTKADCGVQSVCIPDPRDAGAE